MTTALEAVVAGRRSRARRRVLLTTGIGVAVFAAFAVTLMIGNTFYSPDEVVRVILGQRVPGASFTVGELRLPRAATGVLVGFAFGLAGASFQTMLRNPLASPDILGLSNGAFTGMLVALVLVSSSWQSLTVGALIGGVATSVVIWVLSYRGGIQGFRLIVIGIGVAAMLASFNTWMLLQIELETAMFASAWGTGTLNAVTAGSLGGALLSAAPFVLVATVLGPSLRQLDLGDDVAAASGARPNLVRGIALVVGVALVAAATSVAGPIAFVSLAAPQVARFVARTPHLSLGLSAVFGAVILLASDLVAQHLLPVALPVGVVTVSVGGAYLVLMIVLEIRRRA